jgi:predicted oxidoreductase|tara:strand:- start:538 stop:711 length:174 start_codon:yes stop_codon:yes gene_type:complete
MIHSLKLTEEECAQLQFMVTERLNKYRGDESKVLASINEKLQDLNTDNMDFYDAVDY